MDTADPSSSIDSPTASPAVHDAWNWLDDHGDVLFNFALRKVHNIHVAEDLVQETLLAAMRARQSFAGRSSVRSWLTGILKHKIVDHLRSSKRQQRLSEEALEQWANCQFSAAGKWISKPQRWRSSPCQIENAELSAALDECLQRLPARSADVLLMAELQHKSTEALSTMFNASATNIGVILHRARLAMRHCLETKWFGRRKDGLQ